MTRVTDFGRKRTYIESGLRPDPITEPPPESPNSNAGPEAIPGHLATETGDVALPPVKKKRKRTKMSKRDGNAGSVASSEGKQLDPQRSEGSTAATSQLATVTPVGVPAAGTKSEAKRKRKQKQREREKRLKAASASASEVRRQRRISEKQADTTCFACREKGHAAKDCPRPQEAGGGVASGKSVVGICYRCGSTKHNLSHCKKPPKDSDPLPFASCFVCSAKGHLASGCPRNKGKGIYPNGGCCKLCGDTTHLAKDCGLGQRDAVHNSATILGTGPGAGADEDDFHILKRRTAEVEKDGKREDRARRLIDVKAGVHSGIIKPFGKIKTNNPAAKVVNF